MYIPENFDYFQLMKELDNLTQLKLNNDFYECLLCNHPQAADYFYDQTHGHLTLKIIKKTESDYFVLLHINSIDDGSISIMGPYESKDKAQRRLLILKSHISIWGKWIPNAEQIQKACMDSGCYWNR